MSNITRLVILAVALTIGIVGCSKLPGTSGPGPAIAEIPMQEAATGVELHVPLSDFVSNPGEQTLSGVRVINKSCDIQAEVAHEREGVSGIHCQRCQHWKDCCLEVVVYPESLAFVELFVVEQMGAMVEQFTPELTAVMLLLAFQKRCEVVSYGL